MISFYPGPSKIYPEVAAYMQLAVEKGILSINHRSEAFTNISKNAIELLKIKLNIPKDYTVLFTSSATECWEIIAQSLIKNKSYHIYNGSFGEKWFEYTQKLKPGSKGFEFNFQQEININALKIPASTEVICLVQNETSNGTQVSAKNISGIKKKFPKALLAVDATSSLAGVNLPIKDADVWLASVQKCFGLPAGMGIMVCSPRAIQAALKYNEAKHYNSLTFMVEKIKVWQTPYTPNVLSIFLLQQVLISIPFIKKTDILIRLRAESWYNFFSNFQDLELLIKNKDCRSNTVITVKGKEEKIKSLKAKAKKEGILLGNGYGKWSKNTFRIANFPAIEEKEIKLLEKFFIKNIK